MSVKLLKSVIKGVLNESISETAPNLSKESVDDQIDAQLVSYEKNSIGEDEFELDVHEGVDDEDNEFDLVRFSNKLTRLVHNYDSLLDIKTVVLYRAVKYVEENHGTEKAEELKKRLSDIHGLHVSKEHAPSKHEAPPAVGAEGIPSAGGGGG